MVREDYLTRPILEGRPGQEPITCLSCCRLHRAFTCGGEFPHIARTEDKGKFEFGRQLPNKFRVTVRGLATQEMVEVGDNKIPVSGIDEKMQQRDRIGTTGYCNDEFFPWR